MKHLRIFDLMDLNGFICFADEVDSEMELFTTADLHSLDEKVACLITTQDNSAEDGPATSGAMCEDVSGAHPANGIEVKLAAIRAVIYVLGDHTGCGHPYDSRYGYTAAEATRGYESRERKCSH